MNDSFRTAQHAHEMRDDPNYAKEELATARWESRKALLEGDALDLGEQIIEQARCLSREDLRLIGNALLEARAKFPRLVDDLIGKLAEEDCK